MMQAPPPQAQFNQASAASKPKIFTNEQLILLRNQIIAFKKLSRNSPVPANVQQVLFGRVLDQAQQPLIDEEHHADVEEEMGGVLDTHQQHVDEQPKHENSLITAPPPSKMDPRTALKLPITHSEHMSRRNRAQIPALLPPGIDLVEWYETCDAVMRSRMSDRQKELEELPSNMTSLSVGNEDVVDIKVRTLIELKALKLADKQRQLRDQVYRSFVDLSTLHVNIDRAKYKRPKKHTLREARLTESLEREQRLTREKNEKQKQDDYYQGIFSHHREMTIFARTKLAKAQKLGKSVLSYHTYVEKEEQRRIERTAKQRLQALKADDEDAYMKLLDQAKDTRITHLIRQTDSYLDNLAQAVLQQQEAVQSSEGGLPVLPAGEDGEDSDGEGGAKVDYYSVSHRIKEEVTEQPAMLVGGTLKDYQLKGLQWMLSLYNNHLNGILADEMGLGKTIQTISLLCLLIEKKRMQGPFLVIVPLSTLTNWTLEFEKWAPSISKIVYKGPPPVRKMLAQQVRQGHFQVLLTTYEFIINDRPVLCKPRWLHMIIDEGHRMKNTKSKLASTLQHYYHTKHRLILTGTPLQNNLPELWALLNFVLPKIFNSVKSFDEWFNTPFANTGGQDRMELSEEEGLLIIRRLHKVLRPFLLRRLKKDVESELPDKVERVLKCKLSALQRTLYSQMSRKGAIRFSKDEKGRTGLKGLSNTIMQLRKICNHPFVFEQVERAINPNYELGTDDSLWRVAGKFELLDRILPKYLRTGHRVLIFFQMTQIMHIMEDFLIFRKFKYLRLDGSTKSDDRSLLLKQFNDPDSDYFIFLLSTRAGGLGLNLQTADTVIIFDSDWNPHQDLQAQDRAHRIGQTKEVRILRLITENSIEERVLSTANLKLEMDGKVIQAGKFDNKSTAAEREAFLRSLLEQSQDSGTRESEEMDDDELNQLLARGDEELAIFREMDEERERTSLYGKDKKLDRLMSMEELPDFVQDDEDDDMSEPTLILGRGARERTSVRYTDGLTDDQWAKAIDNDQDTDAIRAKKEAMIAKRAASKRKRLLLDDDNSSAPSPAPSDTSMTRKRGRFSKAGSVDSDTAGNGFVNGKENGVKSRPKKVNSDPLEPRQRAALTKLFSHVMNEVRDAESADGARGRADIFLELPDKKVYADYYQIIKHPMALNIVERRIASTHYTTVQSFYQDMERIFDNARTYNEEGSLVYEDADVLQLLVREILDSYAPDGVLDIDRIEEDIGDSENEEDDEESVQAPKIKIKMKQIASEDEDESMAE